MPRIMIFNTLSKSLEEFQPLEPPIVRAYFCGPTVYDKTHIGHVRAYLAFDFIKRYLELRGYRVIHVQNITDIDDKIIDRANKEGVSWKDVADRYIKDYLDVMKRLGIRIDLCPRVTEHINDIIEFVQHLIERGYAYIAPSGSVYFDLSKIEDYGILSGRSKQEEWRQEEEYVKEKKHPYDFALWKAAKPGEPWWESPWGPGRPGWHVECVVMSTKYLGKMFDIHGGGQDLVFPHHENELALAKAAYNLRNWVKYWIHVGYLTVHGEKMSKSLGNVVYADEALNKWGPETLRLWVFSSHYRKQLEYSENVLEQTQTLVKRFVMTTSLVKRLVLELEPSYRLSDKELQIIDKINQLEKQFHEAMSDDFNTPKALSTLLQFISLINNEIANIKTLAPALRAYLFIEHFNRVLGILDKHLAHQAKDLEELLYKVIDLIIEVRTELRKRKMYELSDEIRSKLAKLGIKVSDYRDRSVWHLER